ncbi:MAG: glyoxalase [Spirochaetae bacterium HGW-Spirochaetae-7]|jgi:lactoylglutathione lyase|nr:MAG: glyoxalase [Spirochaetae bacterium HGW-Spirochaetae-7]
MKYCWTTITVREMQRSLAFYQDIIGLKLVRRMQPNPDMEIVFLGEGETQVELIWNKATKDVGFGKDISLGFVVESMGKVNELLASKGIPILSGPFQPNPSIRFIYIQDPDGLKVQLVENIR